MKSKLTVCLALAFTILFAGNVSALPSKNEALTACKSHVKSLYEGDVRQKIKKIKARGGVVEVKLRVSAAGDKFNAVCSFARNGDMTYTTDRITVAGS